MSQCPPKLSFESEACTGGTCLDENTCACAETGVTGVGDFVFGSPSCAIRVEVVRGLWAYLAAAYWTLLVIAVVFIVRKVRLMGGVSRLTPRNPAFRNNVLLLAMGGFVMLQAIFLGTTATLRASDPLVRVIAVDPLTTVLFCLGTTSFWTVSNLNLYQFLKINLLQARLKSTAWREKLRRTLARLRIILPLNFALTTLGCFFPMIALSATSEEEMYAYAACHYVLSAFTIVLLGVLIMPASATPLINDIREAIGENSSGSSVARGQSTRVAAGEGAGGPEEAMLAHNKSNSNSNVHTSARSLLSGHGSPPQSRRDPVTATMAQILKRMVFMRDELRRQAAVNFVVALIFGLWTLPQRYSSYFLVFAWTSAVIFGFGALYVNWPSKIPSSSLSPNGEENAHNNNNNSPDASNNNNNNNNDKYTAMRSGGKKEPVHGTAASEPLTTASAASNRNLHQGSNASHGEVVPMQM